MAAIAGAHLTAFYLFDVADEIDLAALRTAIGGGAAPARFAPKSAAPSYFQYANPPVFAEGELLGIADLDGFRPRIKFFDYGVVSLALSRPFAGSWNDLIAISQRYIDNDSLEKQAEAACRELAGRFAASMSGTRQQWLTEDYVVFSVTSLSERLSAEALLAQRSEEIALVLRGERQALSPQEQDDILRNRISYLADDLVIPTWNAAFVYDTEAGALAALEIFEFANSQLLEFRYYDQLLDRELARIYAQLQKPRRWATTIAGRRYVRAARQLHSLFIDVNEITDRTENAWKMLGDLYAARLFNLVAGRLGLAPWKGSVEEKLKTLDDIYRFAVEQVGISRGHFLELTIISILVLELVLFFMGIMT